MSGNAAQLRAQRNPSLPRLGLVKGGAFIGAEIWLGILAMPVRRVNLGVHLRVSSM